MQLDLSTSSPTGLPAQPPVDLGLNLETARRGDQLVEPFAVFNIVQKETGAKQPFLIVTLTNMRGQRMEAKIWSDQMAPWAEVAKGDPLLVSARIDEYKGKLELKVHGLERLAKPHPVLARLNPVYPGDVAALRQELRDAVAALSPTYRAFAEAVFTTVCPEDKFFLATGAKGNHHAFLHGLADHSLEMRSLGLAAAAATDEYPSIEALREAVARINHPGLRRFVELTVAAAIAQAGGEEAFAALPLDSAGAFAHPGGLIAAMLATARGVESAATQRMVAPVVNGSLTLAGALVAELGAAGCVAMVRGRPALTTNGRLLGAVTAGSTLLRQVARAHRDELAALEFSEAAFEDLLHIQVSARGTLADGSPTAPASLEAVLVAYARRSALSLETLRAALEFRVPDEDGFVADAGPAFPHGIQLSPAVAVRLRQRNGGPGVTVAELIDRDLLALGLLFHDLGKIQEYTFDGEPIGMAPSSNAFGHLTSGALLVDEAFEQCAERLIEAGFTREHLAHLTHLVVSHHGQPAWGSPIRPATPEGVLAHQADNTSAKMREVVQILSEQKPNRHRTIENAGKHYWTGVRVSIPDVSPGSIRDSRSMAERLAGEAFLAELDADDETFTNLGSTGAAPATVVASAAPALASVSGSAAPDLLRVANAALSASAATPASEPAPESTPATKRRSRKSTRA